MLTKFGLFGKCVDACGPQRFNVLAGVRYCTRETENVLAGVRYCTRETENVLASGHESIHCMHPGASRSAL
eukprot:6025080-Pyramimonas_sp.AAC.3